MSPRIRTHLARALTVLATGLIATVGSVAGMAPAAAFAASATAHTGARAGHPHLGLLSQTTWVRLGGVFTLDLALTAPDPQKDLVQVAAYPAVTTRSGFDAAAAGVEPAAAGWYDVQSVDSLPPLPDGGVAVHIPVDSNGAAPSGEKAFVPGPGQVYPLEVQLFDRAGAPLAEAFTTFLVIAPSSGQMANRLAVAVVVPLGAPAPVLGRDLGLGPPAGSGIATTERVLEGTSECPVTLEADPEALVALLRGSVEQRSEVSAARSLVERGDQLLPGPFVPLDYSSLEGSGLGDQVAPQVSAGGDALRASLGRAPPTGSWVVDQPLDVAALDSLEHAGLRRLVLPPADLSALPPADTTLTYGRPTPLIGGTYPAVVWGVDERLSARLGDRRSPVLAAEQDLAELVVTQQEAPSRDRGTVLLAPGGVDARVLSTLLSGLPANPYLLPVTLNELFARVPPSADAPARRLAVSNSTDVPGEQAEITTLSSAIGSLHRLMPSASALYVELERALLVAESGSLARGDRESLIKRAMSLVRSSEHQVSLPPAASITLTARSGSLPVTIRSAPHTRVHVILELNAQKLAFGLPRRPNGRCRTTYQSETCDLTLEGALTTLRVPVVSRTSGVFALAIDLETPGGSVLLASDRDAIRSTAVSWVGLVLMVGAGMSLLAWWVNNVRHGRRARRLVPRPGSGGAGPAGIGANEG